MPQELLNQDFLTNKLADLELRLGAMESARQPYRGAWFGVNTSYLSYSTANKINITDAATIALMRVGDRVKLTQTTVKYFYVMQVATNYITVYGGNTYTVSNAVIESFSFSRDSVIIGFPDSFTFTPVASGGTMTVSAVSKYGAMSMFGTEITVALYMWGLTLGGVATANVLAELPWGSLLRTTSLTVFSNVPAVIRNNSINTVGKVTGATDTPYALAFSLINNAVWTLGANVADVETIYKYGISL